MDNRSATLGLRRNHAWSFGADAVYGLKFLKSLPHADQANAAARGIDNYVWQLASEFFPELISPTGQKRTGCPDEIAGFL